MVNILINNKWELYSSICACSSFSLSCPPAISLVGHKNEKLTSHNQSVKYGNFLRQFLPRSTVCAEQYTNKMIAYECPQGQKCFSSVDLHEEKSNMKTYWAATMWLANGMTPEHKKLVWQFIIFEFSKKFLALLQLIGLDIICFFSYFAFLFCSKFQPILLLILTTNNTKLCTKVLIKTHMNWVMIHELNDCWVQRSPPRTTVAEY